MERKRVSERDRLGKGGGEMKMTKNDKTFSTYMPRRHAIRNAVFRRLSRQKITPAEV
jgi:hypothetical protein